MTQTIRKLLLHIKDRQTIEVPAGSKFICAREQHEEIGVWFRCDPDAKKEQRRIAVVGIGHLVESDWTYIGTASLLGGNLIYHIFEIQESGS